MAGPMDKLFDFSNTSNMLETLMNSANQQNAAAKEYADRVAQQRANVVDSASRYEAEAQKALTNLQRVQERGDRARQLAESDSIIDRITLIGEQILNPRDYTADGRSRQIQEQSQQLAAQGQVFNAENTKTDAALNLAQAEYLKASTSAMAGVNMIKANVDGLELMQKGMIATETMRQQNLSLLDRDTLQKATMGPVDPKLNGKVAINGMTYTPVEIQERIKALETREKLAFMSPQATDPQFAAKLEIAQDMQLSTYSLSDLNALKDHGYIMPDGSQVSPNLWDSHYKRQAEMQQSAFDLAMNEQLMKNQVPLMLSDSQALAKNVTTYAAPGTPLAVANNNFLAAANGVAEIAARDQTPEGKIKQVGVLQAAQQNLIKAVDAEANRKAGGDKQLAEIYRAQIIGQQVEPAMVEDVIRSRYIKGSGFGELLPSDVSNRIRKNADMNYDQFKLAAAKDMDPMSPKKSDKELREDAVNQAMEQERHTAGINGINLIQKNVGNRTDSPAAKAGMIPGQVWEIQQRASQIAFDNVAMAENLTQEQILAIKNGRPESAGLTRERAALIAQRVNTEAVMAEYDLYDQQRPGLGYEMQQWFSGALKDMARSYTESLPSLQKVMTGDSVLIQADKLAQRYAMADESATERGRKLAAELATGAKKPENMWPVLLQMQNRMTDSQRQAVYFGVIAPAIKQARAKNANDTVASDMVFDAINSFKSDDSTLMSAIKQLQRGLPEELDKFHTMWTVIMHANQTNTIRAQRVGSDPTLATQQLGKVLPWLMQMQNGE